MKRLLRPQEPGSILILFLLVLLLGWLGKRQHFTFYGPPSDQKIPSKLTGFQKITLGEPIPINSASKDDFEAIPGIGKNLAAQIILKREQMGGFTDLDQLLSVPGIGPKLFQRIKKHVTLGAAPNKEVQS